MSPTTATQSSGSSTAPAATPATTPAPPPQVAAPSSAPAANLPAPVPATKKSYAPKSNVSTTVTGPKGLSQMLSAVSEISFSANADLRLNNYVVPNCTVFYHVLAMCDSQSSRTKRFTDANPDWHPFVSQLYYGILIYYQVLKTQSVGNQISQVQRDFLEYLDGQFQVGQMKIAGPLVPFFQSLAACSGPNDHYNNVTFGIPSNLDASQANSYQAINRINMHLPSIIFILDQFMRLINRFAPVGAAPAVLTPMVTDAVYMDVFGVNAAANAANVECMKTCSARNEINVSFSGMQGFFGTANFWRTVLPFSVATNQSQYVQGNNANLLSFDQYLGFRGATQQTAMFHYVWFREVSRVMQPYADFFHDSVSLGAINTSGIGTIYIETRLIDSLANATMLTAAMATRDVRYQPPGTLRYEIPNITDLTMTYSVTEPGLDLTALQMGILSSFVTHWDVNLNAATQHPGPLQHSVIVGPIFDRADELVTRPSQPLRYIPNLVSGYYHTPTAGTFGN